MSVSFNPVLGWLGWLVIATLLCGLTWRVYRERLQSLSAPWRRTLLTLRFLTTGALLLFLARPAIVLTEPDDRPRRLLLLADSSRSMSVEDGPEGQTRRAAVLSLLQRQAEAFDDERIDVRLYDFSESLEPADEFADRTDGEWTDLAAAITETTKQNRDARVSAAVLFTDGAIRTPKPSTELVSAAVQTFAEETGATLNPVAIGSSTLSSEGVDLAVDEVLVAPTTFEKKTVPVRAKVRLQGFDGRKATVRLLLERPGPEGQAELVPLESAGGATPIKQVVGKGLSRTVSVDLSFRATEVGEFKLRVAVDPVEEELQQTNNVRDSLITVRKGGLRVLYLDTARWEQKFLRRVNTTSQVQVDYVFVPDAETLGELARDGGWFDTAQYDVFLIGDLPAASLDGSRRGAIGDDLADAVRRGAGVGLIAGPNLAERPIRGRLAQTLAAQFQGAAPLPREDGVRLTPTPEGLSHYVLKLGGPDVFETLPPLERVFPLRPVNNVVDVLAETPDGQPLLVAAEAGRGRTLVLGMADTWLWYRAGQEATHQRFWQQVILWLGHKDEEDRSGLVVTAAPREVDRGQSVEIEAFYGIEQLLSGGIDDDLRTEDLNRDSDGRIDVEIVRPDGTTETVLEGGRDDGNRLTYESTDEPGDYVVRATRRTADGEETAETAETAETRFIVNVSDPELDRPAIDLATLDRIAAGSGGLVLTPETFPDWIAELVASLDATDVSRERLISLWDGWPPLLVFLALAVIEWIMRKSRGLV